MELRTITTEDEGLFLAVEDLQALLRAMADDWLSHIPGHVENGEFIEAALDRHAGFILGTAADYFNDQPADA